MEHDSLEDLCDGQIEVKADAEHKHTIYGEGPPYRISRKRFEEIVDEYGQLHEELTGRLREEDLTIEQFLSEA